MIIAAFLVLAPFIILILLKIIKERKPLRTPMLSMDYEPLLPENDSYQKPLESSVKQEFQKTASL